MMGGTWCKVNSWWFLEVVWRFIGSTWKLYALVLAQGDSDGEPKSCGTVRGTFLCRRSPVPNITLRSVSSSAIEREKSRCNESCRCGHNISSAKELCRRASRSEWVC